ncbi:MAG: putative lipid II flippase FtsW [Bauldia sp.]|nr:putative lipid II flippase FtsW [Bauldia sp.]
MVSRADRSVLSEWWWTVDKPLLAGLIVLLVGGVVLSLAGSPPVAERLDLDSFHFVKRHLLFFIPTVLILLGASLLTPRQVRRVSLIMLVVMIVLLIATLFVGEEIKGARRWINLGSFGLQPSEFIKPAFIVVCAWLFFENAQRPDIPGNLFAILLLAILVALLVAQPDFGQTILVTLSWGALFFMAGLPWIWVAAISAVAVGGIFFAYSALPHVGERIDRFLDPSSGDNYQIETALESFQRGGWLGQGPGEGLVKRVLPDSHTDFIFAVAAEEFGIVICLTLVLVFGFVVLRGLSHSLGSEDRFSRLAASGLIVTFGIQSVINMAVNLNLMPAKGMTLPFISYGGSSMMAIAFGMGMALALTRNRPRAALSRDRAERWSPVARPG